MDEFAQVQAGMRKAGVSGWWEVADLTADQRDRLNAAGADRTISHRAIAIVLERWGVKVSAAQVGYWRRQVLGVEGR